MHLLLSAGLPRHAFLLTGLSLDITARDVVDLIESLNETATQITGFQYTSGPNNGTPAILLQGECLFSSVLIIYIYMNKQTNVSNLP